MPTLNFPTNPSVNDTYTFGGKTWIWNGNYWALNTAGSINGVPIGNVTPSTGAFTTLTSTGNISAVGNVTGAYFIGNGSLLTGIVSSGASISNGTSNVTVVSANGDVTIGVAGTGNLAVFSINGLAVAGNITGNGIAITTVSNTAPANPEQGDIWINSDTGKQYIYFTSGGNSQWANMETP